MLFVISVPASVAQHPFSPSQFLCISFPSSIVTLFPEETTLGASVFKNGFPFPVPYAQCSQSHL